MPNSDGTGNIKDGLIRIGFAAIAFLCIFAAGEWSGNLIVMAITGFVTCTLLAKFATSVKWKQAFVWGVIGAAAGIGFYFAL